MVTVYLKIKDKNENIQRCGQQATGTCGSSNAPMGKIKRPPKTEPVTLIKDENTQKYR